MDHHLKHGHIVRKKDGINKKIWVNNMEIKTRTILQQALDDLKELASNKDEEIYIDQIEAKAEALLEYISYLQRKEYNNDMTIKYIKEHLKDGYVNCENVLDILESEVE